MTSLETLPVAVIGAGPVGLAAAAHLLARGLPVRVYEAGATVGASIRDWGHVRLFSPWRYNVDPAAKALAGSKCDCRILAWCPSSRTKALPSRWKIWVLAAHEM